MNTIIIGDDPVNIRAACTCADPGAVVIAAATCRRQLGGLPARTAFFDRLHSADMFTGLPVRQPTTFMLCFRKAASWRKIPDRIARAGFSDTSLIVVQHEPPEAEAGRKGIMYIATGDLVGRQIQGALKKLENRQRLERLRQLTGDAGDILILMQHDPDPDALASGLALRRLLDRNHHTAPLGTFGGVTRNENLNMTRLLDIQVLKVTPDMLDRFSLIAMVDVQPPYFTDVAVRADIIFDHHPYARSYDSPFADVRTAYGATSTILGQYLLDAEVSISQRLATALVYGIKTDTMSLERDIIQADLEVFTRLYPLANINMIRQIESAALDMHEIRVFIKALRQLTMLDTMACSWLGHIKNEAMIPRLADFCLQVEGAEWSFAAGISQRKVICSARNVGYVRHAGDLMRRVFGQIGSAGGHRSTAKAVIPLARFKKNFDVTTSSQIARALFNALAAANRQQV